MAGKKIYDISRNVTQDLVTWPGDMSVSVKRSSSFEAGDGVQVSRIEMGLHTGTHIDAPRHYVQGAKELHDVDIMRFIGDAKVFELDAEGLISAQDISGLNIEEDDIVLFKTRNSDISDTHPFVEDYIALSLDAAEYLTGKKIKSVGIDYLSIEAFCSKGNPVHKHLLGNEIGIIEGLCLKEVPEGKYFLSCLPLKIYGVEASPVRAVLIKE